MATTKTETEKTKSFEEMTPAEQRAYMLEKVTIHVPRASFTSEFLVDPGYGPHYKIKPGNTVEVTRIAAQIIEQSMAQDEATADMIDNMQANARF